MFHVVPHCFYCKMHCAEFLDNKNKEYLLVYYNTIHLLKICQDQSGLFLIQYVAAENHSRFPYSHTHKENKLPQVRQNQIICTVSTVALCPTCPFIDY